MSSRHATQEDENSFGSQGKEHSGLGFLKKAEKKKVEDEWSVVRRPFLVLPAVVFDYLSRRPSQLDAIAATQVMSRVDGV